jgi:hemoglobin
MDTTGTERHDIDTRADCELLVRSFYERVMADPIIGFLFTDIARLDLDEHVPRITSFWETILLGAQTYTTEAGGPFRPHVELNAKVPLQSGHFHRWLYLWHGTVDELFIGDRADRAKAHADRVAVAFQSRLRSLQGQQLSA